MRILPTALAISAVLHTSAIAWVVAQNPAHLEALRPVTTPITIEEPVAVALLDDHTVKAIPETPSPPRNTMSGSPMVVPHHTAGATHVSTGAHGTSEVHAAATTTTTTGTDHGNSHNPYMTMRHPEIDHGISGDFLDRFLDSSKPLDPETVALRSDESAIDRGKDAHNIRHHGTGYRAEDTPYDANIEPDGTTHLKDKPTFDATDAAMRKVGIDPYASKKLKWLDDTREERYRIGKQYKHELLGKSAQLAKRNLDALWMKLPTTADRKQALFDLWDECAETGSEDLVAGGKAARMMIVGFIRGHLTGNDAYSATELAELNRGKKSTAAFDPYSD